MNFATAIILFTATASAASNTSHAISSAAPQTNFIRKCSYNLVTSKSKTWPGVDVCNGGTQNSCIYDPMLAVGLCQWGNYGTYISTQILTNATNFWTVAYNSYPKRVHCQEGTEMKKLPKNMQNLPKGELNACMPYFPGDGKLNPDWEEPTNFCSSHGHLVRTTKDAHSCVGAAISTSTGNMNCKLATVYKSTLNEICGGTVWSPSPPCGCFGGYKYFY